MKLKKAGSASAGHPVHIPAVARSRGEFKLCVCGGGAVGKSALTIQFINGAFIKDYDPTIEDSYRKQHHVDGHPCLLDVLDTAGQEDYTSLRPQYMRRGDGFLLVFSLIDRLSFDEVTAFHQEICRAQDRDDPPCVLIGNKADLESMRQVATVEGRDLARTFGCPYIETSAKENMNVNNAFED